MNWPGCAEQAALAAGALLVPGFADSHARVRRCLVPVFGLWVILFGIARLVYLDPTAAMVPAWLPGRQRFWAVATGLADLLAGGAIVIKRASTLACIAVGAMFVTFGVLVWRPMLVHGDDLHFAVAGAALTFGLAGSAWIVTIPAARQPRR